MRSLRWSIAADAAICAALFLVSAVTLLRATDTTPFHGDESEWINASRYFKYLVLDRDVSGPVWQPSFITRDQPPFGRYLIGATLWALGNDPMAVNRAYAWSKDRATNEQEGRVPGPHLLQPVRRMMAVLGAASIVGLYLAGRLLEGPITGSVAALLVLVSPLLQLHFSQARTEAPLALLTSIALAGTLIAARRWESAGRLPRAVWLVGVALGLALSTKLTAALGIIATCGYGALAAVREATAGRRGAGRITLWSVVTGAVALGVFVAVNPFLWRDPVGRTYSMLEQQRNIMLEQGQQFGNPAPADLAARAQLVVRRTFVANSTPAFDLGLPPDGEPLVQRTFLDLPAPWGLSLELVLATMGFLVVCWRAAESWWGVDRLGPDVALLCWLVAYFVGITGNLSLDWPRYYVPTAFLGSLLIGLGLATLLQAVVSFMDSRTSIRLRLGLRTSA